jgi:hypothetical protein
MSAGRRKDRFSVYQAMLDDHQLLRSLAEKLEQLLDASSEPGICIARARWGLARALMRHLAQEPAVLAKVVGSGALAATLDRHHQGREARLRADLDRHMREWTPERIRTDFALFRRDLRRLLRALEECMRFEETVLYREVTPLRRDFSDTLA